MSAQKVRVAVNGYGVIGNRMRRLRDIAGEYGRPWWKKWTGSIAELTDVSLEWYRHY